MLIDCDSRLELFEAKVAEYQLMCNLGGIELLEEAKRSALLHTQGRLSICSLTIGAFQIGLLRDTFGPEIDFLHINDILDAYGVLKNNE